MNTPVIIAIGAAIVAAPVLYFGHGAVYEDLSDRGCAVVPTEPYAGVDARTVQIRIENEQRAQRVRLCVIESRQTERYEDEVVLPAADTLVFAVRVAPGADRVTLELDRPDWKWAGYSVIAAGASIPECEGGVPELAFVTRYSMGGSGIVGPRSGCAAPAPAGPDAMGIPSPLGTAPDSDSAGGRAALLVVLAAGAVTAGALTLAFHARGLRAGLVALFSRLVRPRLLDHGLRARIVEAVAADPGLHASEIARRVGAEGGVFEYHLGVLLRERILASVAAEGFRHYFPHGRFAPHEMRRRALLRHAHLENLFAVVRQNPGIEAGAAARRLGLSAPRVSKLSARLSEAGLVRRERVGRRVLLSPA